MTHHTTSAMNDTTVERFITPNQLKAKISEYDNQNETQRNRLMTVLMKYQLYLTKRPGKCTGFE